MNPSRLSVLYYLSVAVMELSYLYLPASLLGGPSPVLVLVLLLHPIAFLTGFITRSSSRRQTWLVLEVSLVALVIVIIVGERVLDMTATGVPDVFGIIMRLGMSGIAWFLGHTVPRTNINFSAVAFRLQIGIVVILLFAQAAGSAPAIVLFFLAAPAALYLSRWAASYSHNATGLRTPNPGNLLFGTASIVVPAGAIILFLSPGIARTIVDWLGAVLLNISSWLDSQHEVATEPSEGFKFDFNLSCNIQPEQSAPPPTMETPPPSGGAGEISPVVVWIILAIIFLTVIALIAFLLVRRRDGHNSRPARPVRFHTRAISPQIFRGLLFFFPRLLQKFLGWLSSLYLRWKERRMQPEDRSVRAVYRTLLRWAARHGEARSPAQTPLEHLELLERRFPAKETYLKEVIAIYLTARYGREPVSDKEFTRAKQAWRAITT